MAIKISLTKGFDDDTFDTYVPQLSDNADIQNAFELFYYGDSTSGNTEGDVSLHKNIVDFDTRITSNTTFITGHDGTTENIHGTMAGSEVVGTLDTQTLSNKTLSSPTLSGTTTATSGTIALGTNSSAITANSATISATEIGYLDSASANIQTQLNSKASNTDPVITGEINTTGNVIGHITINSKSTSYTLVLSDDGDFLEFTGSSAGSLTVPTNASVAFPIGTVITVLQAGTGQVTITPATVDVVINSTPGLKTRAQWSVVTLIKRGTNTWLATGDLSA
jgi:hypothetical protein